MVIGTVRLMQDLADCKVHRFAIVGLLSEIPIFQVYTSDKGEFYVNSKRHIYAKITSSLVRGGYKMSVIKIWELRIVLCFQKMRIYLTTDLVHVREIIGYQI
jgi:hypothetical protein